MKKLLLAAIAIMFLAASCKKDSSSEVTPSPAPTSQKGKMSPMSGYSGYRMYWRYDPWRSNCVNISSNCHPEDIVITAPKKKKLEETFQILAAENNSAIQTFLTENYAVLSSDIPTEWLDAGISGEYDVRYYYSRDNDTKFIFFMTGDQISMAFPFVNEI
jgi:hypothetical protein